eukprot:345322_1
MQECIANQMINFVNSQTSKGMNLLFIGTVGDNFYPAGQSCIPHDPGWGFPFYNKYNYLANDTYWLAVKGNHDWANLDPNAMCPWANPKYIDPNTKIPYAGLQLNKDKGGCNPDNYYLPDYGYYYSIPQLNFEWIAMDENANPCSNGDLNNDFKDCGFSQKTGCDYLKKIQTATELNMKQRANVSNNNNFMIIQHYSGGQLQKFNDQFKSIRGNDKDYRVWGAAGHTHTQLCMHNDTTNGVCDQIRTGGGGTGNVNDIHGFYVIGFDENKQMIQPYQFDDPLISCMPPCGQGEPYTDEEKLKANFYYCCTDPDEADLCNIYDTSKCP